MSVNFRVAEALRHDRESLSTLAGVDKELIGVIVSNARVQMRAAGIEL
jgi:hypothetical protein